MNLKKKSHYISYITPHFPVLINKRKLIHGLRFRVTSISDVRQLTTPGAALVLLLYKHTRKIYKRYTRNPESHVQKLVKLTPQ